MSIGPIASTSPASAPQSAPASGPRSGNSGSSSPAVNVTISAQAIALHKGSQADDAGGDSDHDGH